MQLTADTLLDICDSVSDAMNTLTDQLAEIEPDHALTGARKDIQLAIDRLDAALERLDSIREEREAADDDEEDEE